MKSNVMERIMKWTDLVKKACCCVALGLVIMLESGCGAAPSEVIKANVSEEDQNAAESSVLQHDSDDYAKSISEQNGPR